MSTFWIVLLMWSVVGMYAAVVNQISKSTSRKETIAMILAFGPVVWVSVLGFKVYTRLHK